MNHDNKQNGFTLIELMLAMTFIAVLLVAIAMTTIQISNIYSKGITLREVNQAGRAITDDLQRGIASSTPFDVTPREDTSPATVGSRYIVRPGGGRLCLGNYSYIWNYGKALVGGAGAPAIFNKYTDSSPVRFAKVADARGALCNTATTNIDRSVAIEMLTSGDRDLVMHAFTIAQTSSDPTTGQAIYAISMLVGTNDRDQLTANDASCKPPSEGVGDETYCSVNQFDIIARAGNRSGGE
ncbi:MAG TPA: prepilin-type N-terminal cleavage/methylation domain-containing protein [Candidatus Saccharimonadales bacterium]|nr:prepilin-type N-terminal cleavage/methylation domain-containing protein [Candidatus Saccharimonadales bacterium]